MFDEKAIKEKLSGFRYGNKIVKWLLLRESKERLGVGVRTVSRHTGDTTASYVWLTAHQVKALITDLKKFLKAIDKK